MEEIVVDLHKFTRNFPIECIPHIDGREVVDKVHLFVSDSSKMD